MKGGLLFIIGALTIFGCVRNRINEGYPGLDDAGLPVKYAGGFSIIDFRDYKIIQVFNPWQNTNDITFTYVLGEDKLLVPDSLGEFPFIRIPVSKVITLSTTHLAMINQLGKQETIRGVSGAGLIYDTIIRKKIKAGEVLDVGYDQGLNYETIVSIDPDVLFMYGVEGTEMGTLEKLRELGIPVVFCGEYLETHPLGKSEWIRFFSQFFNKERESELFFNRIDSAYNSLADLAGGVTQHPEVLLGLPWKDTWYVAGGESFSVKLLEDAGGEYLWSETNSTQAIPMDIESVYIKALDADFWINPGAANSLEELSLFDERFKELPVFQNGSVFNNNARLGEMGGNDYWESGTIHPEQVLADLIAIFHPNLLPDHQFIYYKKLK